MASARNLLRLTNTLDASSHRVPMFSRLFSTKRQGKGPLYAGPVPDSYIPLWEVSPNRNFNHSEADIESEEKLWDLYKRWMEHFNITRSPDEINECFEQFKKAAKSTLEFNKKGMSYTQGLSYYADRSLKSCTPKDNSK